MFWKIQENTQVRNAQNLYRNKLTILSTRRDLNATRHSYCNFHKTFRVNRDIVWMPDHKVKTRHILKYNIYNSLVIRIIHSTPQNKTPKKAA